MVQIDGKELVIASEVVKIFVDALPQYSGSMIRPVLGNVIDGVGKEEFLWLLSALVVQVGCGNTFP